MAVPDQTGRGTVTVLAASRWRSNAELILSCRELGYLRDDDRILDPTYGKGTWWKRWHPKRLVIIDGDFRSLPLTSGSFDAVVYDPPYVSVGGRTTTGLPAFHERYGMDDTPRTPAGLQEVIDHGLTEMHRLVKPGGFVLAKCQSYVSSGKLWRGTYYTERHAESLGFTTFDELVLITSPRPQPPRERQCHARRNLSTLFVFQRGRS